MANDKLQETVPTDLLYQALETEKGGVHIYSTALRCVINQELIEALGMPAVLPPPEEVKKVETAIEAAKAKKARAPKAKAKQAAAR